MASDRARFLATRGSDRRGHVRRAVDLLANRFVEGQPRLLRVVDLSATGLRATPLGAGGAVGRFGGLQFQLPDAPELITASAEALEGGAETGEVRLRFTVLSEEARRRLTDFVARSSEGPNPPDEAATGSS